jgi:hypothetical protein
MTWLRSPIIRYRLSLGRAGSERRHPSAQLQSRCRNLATHTFALRPRLYAPAIAICFEVENHCLRRERVTSGSSTNFLMRNSGLSDARRPKACQSSKFRLEKESIGSMILCLAGLARGFCFKFHTASEDQGPMVSHVASHSSEEVRVSPAGSKAYYERQKKHRLRCVVDLECLAESGDFYETA